MAQEIIVVKGLCKRFGSRQVLAGVDLRLERGECVVLLGPSGCGKTTLLRLIAGLDDADAGVVEINGAPASNPKVLVAPNDRRLAMVFQDLALWPHMRAWENVEFMLPRTTRGKALRKSKARGVLAAVHLDGHHDSYPHELSRGQQQRVALARALASEPAILLLDEPFASQDSVLKNQMVELVLEIRRTNGMTLLYVTHTTDEIPRLADRVAKLEAGTLCHVSNLDEFHPSQGRHESS